MTLAKLPDLPMPRDHEQLLHDLEAVLAEDRDFAGEDLDLSRGLPAQLGTRGSYGDHGPFNVVVNPGVGGSDGIVISAFSQSQIYMSEAIAALGRRVAAKDRDCNEVLVITCGLVDENGYACPADQSIFQLLRGCHAGRDFCVASKASEYQRHLDPSVEHAIPVSLGSQRRLAVVLTPA